MPPVVLRLRCLVPLLGIFEFPLPTLLILIYDLRMMPSLDCICSKNRYGKHHPGKGLVLVWFFIFALLIMEQRQINPVLKSFMFYVFLFLVIRLFLLSPSTFKYHMIFVPIIPHTSGLRLYSTNHS